MKSSVMDSEREKTTLCVIPIPGQQHCAALSTIDIVHICKTELHGNFLSVASFSVAVSWRPQASNHWLPSAHCMYILQHL